MSSPAACAVLHPDPFAKAAYDAIQAVASVMRSGLIFLYSLISGISDQGDKSMTNVSDPTFCFNLERLRDALLSPLSVDLDALQAELAAAKTELKTDLESARTVLDTRVAGVQSALSAELAETGNALNLELTAVKNTLTPMATNIEQLQTELAGVKNTLAPIPSDMQYLRTDLAVIKSMLEQMQNNASRSGLKSVQRGTLYLSAPEVQKDVAITPVNPGKAFLSVNAVYSGGYEGITAQISAPDKLTLSRKLGPYYADGAAQVQWEVIEFY